ncbi:MAG: maltoporin [Psychromonas sp.]|jgi:maltoporin|uniref:carbohydrate porin n=1 Tax=Psychromonas sp. TaxID=1884585 RepID=UPI0039E26536
MKFKTLTAAVAVALLSASASAVDFNGYARSGVGASADGGQITANDGVAGVGRLGNEGDTYAEFALGQNVYDDNGVKFSVHTLMAYGLGGDKADWAESGALREVYVKGSGLLGTSTLWAGKRYYQRHDIHIVDDYYWAINGEGAGIENIALGNTALSLAWFQRGGSNGSANTNILDARLAGIQMWKNASLEVGVMSWMPNAETDADNASTMLTAEYTQGDFFGGFNKVVLQAGNYGFANGFVNRTDGSWVGDASDASDDAMAFRIYNHGVVSAGDKVNLAYTLNFATGSDLTETDDGDFTLYNVVVRPQYSWTENMKTQLEAGVYVKEAGTVDSSEAKFTVAQSWSPASGFWSRPEIRVFATYLTDLEDGEYANGEDNALSIGVQAEAWW